MGKYATSSFLRAGGFALRLGQELEFPDSFYFTAMINKAIENKKYQRFVKLIFCMRVSIIFLCWRKSRWRSLEEAPLM